MSLQSVEECMHTIWKPVQTHLDLLPVQSFCWRYISEVKPICQQFSVSQVQKVVANGDFKLVAVMLGALICILQK
jgi:hypothetical protein